MSLIGKKFSRLLVLRKDEKRKRHWICRCDCGQEKSVYRSHLVGRKTRSCGCLRKEQVSIMFSIIKRTHGMIKTKAYRAWVEMHRRCKDLRRKGYKNYGGRGIRVCERWSLFENFFADMGHASKEESLDRIDVNGDYEPSNCRWATQKEQARNRRNNRILKLGNISKTLIEWAEQTAINPSTICSRIKMGWNDEKILTTPVKRKRS